MKKQFLNFIKEEENINLIPNSFSSNIIIEEDVISNSFSSNIMNAPSERQLIDSYSHFNCEIKVTYDNKGGQSSDFFTFTTKDKEFIDKKDFIDKLENFLLTFSEGREFSELITMEKRKQDVQSQIKQVIEQVKQQQKRDTDNYRKQDEELQENILSLFEIDPLDKLFEEEKKLHIYISSISQKERHEKIKSVLEWSRHIRAIREERRYEYDLARTALLDWNPQFTTAKLKKHIHNLMFLRSNPINFLKTSIIPRLISEERSILYALLKAPDMTKAETDFINELYSYLQGLEKIYPIPPTLLHELHNIHQRMEPEAAKKLLPENLVSDKKQGSHPVIVWKDVHYKATTEGLLDVAPGIEYMVDRLNKLIAGHGSPPTTLLKVTRGEKAIIYQASKTVMGICLRDILETHLEHINKFDAFNFSSLAVLGMLTNPRDGKAENYVVEIDAPLGAGDITTFHIVGIDNDMAFGPSVARKESKMIPYGWFQSEVHNVLFLFPQMENRIDDRFRENLLTLSTEFILIEWLKALSERNNAYNYLKEKNILSEDEMERLKLPLQLPQNLVRSIYRKLKKMQAYLERNPDATHNELFYRVEPVIAEYYQRTREQQSSILNGFGIIEGASLGAEPKESLVYASRRRHQYAISITQGIYELILEISWKKLNAEMEKLLIEQLETIGVFNVEEITEILHQLIQDNKITRRLVRFLIRKGARLNAVPQLRGYHALHTAVRPAVQAKSLEIVLFLLEQGADIKGMDDRGETPLDKLVRELKIKDKEIEWLSQLVTKGAQITNFQLESFVTLISSIYEGEYLNFDSISEDLKKVPWPNPALLVCSLAKGNKATQQSIIYCLKQASLLTSKEDLLNSQKISLNVTRLLHQLILQNPDVNILKEAISLLVNQGALLDAVPELNGYNILHTAIEAAIETNSFDNVLFLFGQLEEAINNKDEDGETPLDKLVKGLNLKDEKAKWICTLLKKGAIISARYQIQLFGFVSSVYKAEEIEKEVLQRLKKIDIAQPTVVLHELIKSDLLTRQLMDILIEQGAELGGVPAFKGFHALHTAVEANSLNVVFFILENRKEEINPLDDMGETPLDKLIKILHNCEEKVEWAKYFLEKGAAISNRYQTEFLNFLIKNYEANQIEGILRPWLEKKYLDHTEILHFLIKNNKITTSLISDLIFTEANLGAVPALGGFHALHTAVEADSLEIVRYLLENGENGINPLDDKGETPLDKLVRGVHECEKKIEWIKELLERGAIISLPSQAVFLSFFTKNYEAERIESLLVPWLKKKFLNHTEILHILIRSCKLTPSLLSELISTEASLGAIPELGGFHALHTAFETGSFDIVQYLLENGENEINPLDNMKETPLDKLAKNLAVRDERIAWIPILKSKGCKTSSSVSDGLIDLVVKYDLELKNELSLTTLEPEPTASERVGSSDILRFNFHKQTPEVEKNIIFIEEEEEELQKFSSSTKQVVGMEAPSSFLIPPTTPFWHNAHEPAKENISRAEKKQGDASDLSFQAARMGKD